MILLDLIARVAAKCDDADQTYVTPELVTGLAQESYEWLFSKLRLTDYQFDEQIIILPAVPAGTPDLVTYQQPGGLLEQLVQPRMVRWRLPGQDNSHWRRAEGPLDSPRDMPGDGFPALDSWAWVRFVLELSAFSTALDLEVTGSFLFDPLTSPDSPVEISKVATRALSCKIASEVGKARGNDKWVTLYGADADEAVDDLTIEMVKADQAKSHRVARMTRNTGNRSTQISPGR